MRVTHSQSYSSYAGLDEITSNSVQRTEDWEGIEDKTEILDWKCIIGHVLVDSGFSRTSATWGKRVFHCGIDDSDAAGAGWTTSACERRV